MNTDLLNQDMKQVAPWILVAVWLWALTAWHIVETVETVPAANQTSVLIGLVSVLLGAVLTVVSWQVTIILDRVLDRYTDEENDGS